MDCTPQMADGLVSLVSHLAARRPDVLRAWRESVERDPDLTTPNSLPRHQFNDHIPALLDALAHKLLVRAGQFPPDAGEAKRQEDAATHGLQRWQQGYHPREVTREWGHLHLRLADELERFTDAHPHLDPHVMPAAWRTVAEFCSAGVADSAARYFQLQQTEAEGHARDLERTLAEVREAERLRGELLREATHDLRGQFGAVRNATNGLTLPNLPDAARERFTRLLERTVGSLHAMLDDVMDLARLQAGREVRVEQAFDAAAVLRDLCDGCQPQADGRGLYLRTDGPPEMAVAGDPGKVRRIAQNLTLNALKCTTAGGVTIGWADGPAGDPLRWVFWVKDTGPGFQSAPGAPVADALKDATADAKKLAGEPVPPPPVAPPYAPDRTRGEGIGLSIVKRLCELLDATLELESNPGEGSTFRVLLPKRYGAGG
jgi:signal transduction histidine kinase